MKKTKRSTRVQKYKSTKGRILTLLLFYFCTLLPSLAEATTRYVKTGCTNGVTTYSPSANTCTGGSDVVYSTINNGISAMNAQDTLYIRVGTYNERILGNLPPNGGGDSTRSTISSYNGETVTIAPSSDGTSIIQFADPATQYLTFNGIIFDGTHVTGGPSTISWSQAASHIRFTNCEVKNTSAADFSGSVGAGFIVGGTFNEFINVSSHDNGRKPGTLAPEAPYGFYVGGDGHVLDHVTVYQNGGYGIHVYNSGSAGASNVTVKNSLIYNNGLESANNIVQVLLTTGSGHQIQNSIIYTTGGYVKPSITGISIGTNGKVYNNTIRGLGGKGILLEPTSNGAVVKNNISVSNLIDIENNGLGNTLDHNFCTSGCTGTGSINGNPLFVDVLAADFRLQTTSLAKNAGADLSAIFTVDNVGTTRPQGSAFDMGAFEFAAPPSCQTNPHSLVGYWTFNSVATDSSGNGFTASLGSGVTYAAAHIGNGLIFPGTAGATVTDASLLDLCDGFTLAGWINIPNTSTDRMFIVKEPNNKYFLGMLNGYCRADAALIGGYAQNANVVACDTTALATGTDIHVAVTYDGTTVRLYKNALLVDSVAGGAALDATAGNLLFCYSGFGEFCPNTTLLDDVRIYTYARSLPELVSDMGMSRTVKVGLGQTVKVGVQ